MSSMEQERPPGRTRRRVTKDFKADAVVLALDGAFGGGNSPSGTSSIPACG